MFNALHQWTRTLTSLTVLTVLGVGGWYGYKSYMAPQLELEEKSKLLKQQQARLAKLEAVEQQLREDNAELRENMERLALAVRLLKVDRRIAQIVVLDQWEAGPEEQVHTKFSFTEFDNRGEPLYEPRLFTIEGDVVYVDYWVAKFQDHFVEQQDPLRHASIALFRRVFGENQRPRDGFALDEEDVQPAAYASEEQASVFEREIWENFWEYATDKNKAESAGLRAAHGEAVAMRLDKGETYRLVLRSSGGLTFAPASLGRSSGEITL